MQYEETSRNSDSLKERLEIGKILRVRKRGKEEFEEKFESSKRGIRETRIGAREERRMANFELERVKKCLDR
jgi:hypothetical protein